eukprot:SAG25_NODE_218_length_11648_cov_35.885358_1_plen_404_part_10
MYSRPPISDAWALLSLSWLLCCAQAQPRVTPPPGCAWKRAGAAAPADGSIRLVDDRSGTHIWTPVRRGEVSSQDVIFCFANCATSNCSRANLCVNDPTLALTNMGTDCSRVLSQVGGNCTFNNSLAFQLPALNALVDMCPASCNLCGSSATAQSQLQSICADDPTEFLLWMRKLGWNARCDTLASPTKCNTTIDKLGIRRMRVGSCAHSCDAKYPHNGADRCACEYGCGSRPNITQFYVGGSVIETNATLAHDQLVTYECYRLCDSRCKNSQDCDCKCGLRGDSTCSTCSNIRGCQTPCMEGCKFAERQCHNDPTGFLARTSRGRIDCPNIMRMGYPCNLDMHSKHPKEAPKGTFVKNLCPRSCKNCPAAASPPATTSPCKDDPKGMLAAQKMSCSQVMPMGCS